MHDTDSIIYHSIPGAYDTDLGHLLGDWELDKLHRKGTLVEFWGLRPKSYGLRTDQGAEIIKLKGISLSLDAQQHATFQNVKNLVTHYTPGKNINVNQLTFKWTPTLGSAGGMVTQEYVKKISPASPDELKGCLAFDGSRKIYPFGYVMERDDTGRQVVATREGWNYVLDFTASEDSPAYAPLSPLPERPSTPTPDNNCDNDDATVDVDDDQYFRCAECDQSLNDCHCPPWMDSDCNTDDIKEGKVCWGCHHDCPGQSDHMGPGGCLEHASE
jgi:hypothetical protein